MCNGEVDDHIPYITKGRCEIIHLLFFLFLHVAILNPIFVYMGLYFRLSNGCHLSFKVCICFIFRIPDIVYALQKKEGGVLSP